MTLTIGTSYAQMSDIIVDVVFLSSDYLEGRETGKIGEKRAAEYVMTRFQDLDLQPGWKGSYAHTFDFTFKPNPHDSTTWEKRTGTNVVGYMDNGADNIIIIGAHYDHLGWGISGSRNTGEKAIHNGADDNASGVAGVLYLAETLKDQKYHGNNYLFIAFSGEELGLFGSKNFAKELETLEKPVNYMLNMDMIGRLNEEKTIAVYGTGTTPGWNKVLDDFAEEKGLTLSKSESGVGPSDHTSFYLQDLPVLHFFTGQHQDYHMPTDDAHLINYEGIETVCSFLTDIIGEFDDDGKLAFTKTADNTQKTVSRFKVTLGVMPDYVFQGKGMRIDGVIDGRPAANAGMENGDIVIKMGDKEVSDIYEYMEALGMFKKGDSTIVKAKREDKVLEFNVKF